MRVNQMARQNALGAAAKTRVEMQLKFSAGALQRPALRRHGSRRG